MEELINSLRKQMELINGDFVGVNMTLRDGYVLTITLAAPDQEDEDDQDKNARYV